MGGSFICQLLNWAPSVCLIVRDVGDYKGDGGCVNGRSTILKPYAIIKVNVMHTNLGEGLSLLK